MALALIHPGLLANLGLAKTGDEVRRVIGSLTAWSRAHDNKTHACHISEETLAVLYEHNAVPALPMLNALHSRYGDGTWHPNLLIPAWYRLLAADQPGTALQCDAKVTRCDHVSLTPCVIEDDLPEPLVMAAKHDAALLASAGTGAGKESDWIVAASTRRDLPSLLSVQVDGEIETSRLADGAVRHAHVEDTLLYVFDPLALDTSTEEESFYAQVREQVAGMQALVIGGDGRDFNEQAVCRCLGLARAVFVSHFRGPGQNIRRARQMLQSGNYDLYIHITRFGSHSPANLKDYCPPHCRYVAVNGSATPLNIARAIAHVLHLQAEE